jgi:hypothetical protein
VLLGRPTGLDASLVPRSISVTVVTARKVAKLGLAGQGKVFELEAVVELSGDRGNGRACGIHGGDQACGIMAASIQSDRDEGKSSDDVQ